MADDFTFEGMLGEEIEGAPPVATSAELRERRLSERVSINRYLYQQAQQFEYMLMDAPDLAAVLELLLVSMPRHFSFQVAELWLYDPESVLESLIDGGQRYGPQLQLLEDSFGMQELYDLELDPHEERSLAADPAYAAELEALLLTHPSIADAAVVQIPDEEAGEAAADDNKRIVSVHPKVVKKQEEVFHKGGHSLQYHLAGISPIEAATTHHLIEALHVL